MPKTEENTVWEDIATLINALPRAERRRYYEGVRRWGHELGHNIGLIRTSEGLLRREMEDAQEADTELLDIIRDAANQLLEMMAEIRCLGEAISDSKISPPEQKKR